jgi:hypothetical protein
MTRFIPSVIAAAVVMLAPTAHAQSACEQKVLSAYDNPMLRLQFYEGAGSQSSREAAKVHLWHAQRSAELGDEAGCWNQYGWAAYLVKPPATN